MSTLSLSRECDGMPRLCFSFYLPFMPVSYRSLFAFLPKFQQQFVPVIPRCGDIELMLGQIQCLRNDVFPHRLRSVAAGDVEDKAGIPQDDPGLALFKDHVALREEPFPRGIFLFDEQQDILRQHPGQRPCARRIALLTKEPDERFRQRDHVLLCDLKIVTPDLLVPIPGDQPGEILSPNHHNCGR